MHAPRTVTTATSLAVPRCLLTCLLIALVVATAPGWRPLVAQNSSRVIRTAGPASGQLPSVPQTTPQPFPYEPIFRQAECPFVVPWNESITCGRLSVPENRNNQRSTTIGLFVAILHSRGPTTQDPVLVLPGGPGGDALGDRETFYALGLHANRDVILMDPRGTGASIPSLECIESEWPAVQSEEVTDSYATCAARLQREGRDLNGYVADEIVADAADLARALGITRLNLYATSYGTRVALLLANRHPNLVRSMVLDSVLPPSVNALTNVHAIAWAAFRRIAHDCAANEACNAAYPALETRLLEIVERYNRSPLPADLGHGSGDDILRLLYKQMLHGGGVLPLFITTLYNEDYVKACSLLPPESGCFYGMNPSAKAQEDAEFTSTNGTDDADPLSGLSPEWRSMLASAANPSRLDTERVTWLMQELNLATPEALAEQLNMESPATIHSILARLPAPRSDRLSEGVFASVICSGEVPHVAAKSLAQPAPTLSLPGRLPPVQSAEMVKAICEKWPVLPSGSGAKVSVSVSVPTLLVSGTHDPVTPTGWARLAAAYLPNARLQLFPGYGHGVLMAGNACLEEVMARFYAAPEDDSAVECTHHQRIQWAGLAE